MIVIGLTGKAGSGKDTVADHLVKTYGFTKLSFASDLKDMLNTLDPYLGDGIRLSEVRQDAGRDSESVLKSHFPEYRRLLQTLGTECIRERDPVFWINRLLTQVEAAEGNVVVTDCRFPNEVEALESAAFGITDFWHVIRPNLRDPGNHASEKYAGRMGETPLYNSGSLKILHLQIDAYLAEIQAGVRG